MEALRDLWNRTCLEAGIPALNMDTAAIILAVVYLHGNNEAFCFNGAFLSDIEYIQQRFRMSGGETPDPDFVEALNKYIRMLGDFERQHQDDRPERDALFKRHIPEWVAKLFKERYNIKIKN